MHEAEDKGDMINTSVHVMLESRDADVSTLMIQGDGCVTVHMPHSNDCWPDFSEIDEWHPAGAPVCFHLH